MSMDSKDKWGTILAITGLVFIIGICFFESTDWDKIKENREEKARQETIEKRQNTIVKIHEASENGDFEKAYQLLGELTSSEEDYKDCRDKLVKDECLFLVSQDDEQSAKRIMYLLTRYFDSSFDNRYRKAIVIKEIYALAKKVNNEYVQDYLKDEYEAISKGVY